MQLMVIPIIPLKLPVRIPSRQLCEKLSRRAEIGDFVVCAVLDEKGGVDDGRVFEEIFASGEHAVDSDECSCAVDERIFVVEFCDFWVFANEIPLNGVRLDKWGSVVTARGLWI